MSCSLDPGDDSRADAPATGPIPSGAVKAAPVKPAPVKPTSVKASASKPAPGKSAASKPTASKTAPVKAAPAKTAPGKTASLPAETSASKPVPSPAQATAAKAHEERQPPAEGSVATNANASDLFPRPTASDEAGAPGDDQRFPLDPSRGPWVEEESRIADKLEECQRIVDHRFRNLELLQAALTHASGASHRLGSNERLEFLGDSILGLVVCQWLFEEYPEYSEGDLTKIKSSVVSRRVCGKVACELGLDKCLIVGKGIHQGRSFPKSLVSDVFEAVVAALYLDAGLDIARERLRHWLAPEVRLAVEGRGSGNYKSLLQQFAQRERASTPLYRLVTESGPDHRKRFRVAAVIAGEEFQPAWGNNKKDAEQHAAANALAILHKEPPPFD